MLDHPLFQEHPPSGSQKISVGRVPVPYQTYDGHGTLIGGTADLSNMSSLLDSEQVTPMRTRAGKALFGVWVVDFTEASLDPHKELQFSILVSHQTAEPLDDHPLSLLKALFTNPQARMFSYRLWNDTETAVAYNRELLGLNAQPTVGTITRAEGYKTFHFIDDEGMLLCEGDVREAERPSWNVGWSLVRLMGPRQTMRALTQTYLEAKVVNPTGEQFTENLDAQTYLAADSPVVQFFDKTADTIFLGEPYAEIYQFQPQFVEHFTPFRFVYLPPK